MRGRGGDGSKAALRLRGVFRLSFLSDFVGIFNSRKLLLGLKALVSTSSSNFKL
jgi:hypothetical protein